MRQTRFRLVSNGITITYRNENDVESERAKLLALGIKEYGQWRALAVRVGKVREQCHPRRAAASMVVGIHFRDGPLTIELLNGSSNGLMYFEKIRELSLGIAFDRFTNRYVEQSAVLRIGREALTARSYDLSFESGPFGDCLILKGRLPRAERTSHRVYGQTIIVNLSALFAVGPLTVHHGGLVTYDEQVVLHLPVPNGELFPFLTISHDFWKSEVFMAKGFDLFVRRVPFLVSLQDCEGSFNNERKGNRERTIVQFRRRMELLLLDSPR